MSKKTDNFLAVSVGIFALCAAYSILSIPENLRGGVENKINGINYKLYWLNKRVDLLLDMERDKQNIDNKIKVHDPQEKGTYYN